MIEGLLEHDLPFEGTEERVIAIVREALDLRHGEAGDPEGRLRILPVDASPHEVMLELARVRVRSDRVDELLARVTQAKSRAKRAQDHAEFMAQNAKDEATQQGSARRVEFSARFEREADANLASLEERRVAHHAARLVSITAEAHEVVKQIHWQLDAIRRDLRGTLHALQFESSLER